MVRYHMCRACPASAVLHFHERLPDVGFISPVWGPPVFVGEEVPRCHDPAHHAPDCECALVFDETR